MGDLDTDTIGSIHVSYTYGVNYEKEIWSKSGFQGAGWHEARVFIGPLVNVQVKYCFSAL